METTIFFGNGVNLLGKDGKSWDDVLKQISQRNVLPSIENNTLKYEYVVLPKERYTEVHYGFEITIDGMPEPPELIDTEEFIAKAQAVHGDRYDYSKVEYVAWNIQTRVNT